MTFARHECFAQGLAKGNSQVEAYAEAGYKPDDGAACRLSGNVRIQNRVAELQERAAVRIEFDLAEAARQLDEDRQLAHQNGQAGAAVSATVAKAKLFGLIVDKRQAEATATFTHEERLAELLKLAGD